MSLSLRHGSLCGINLTIKPKQERREKLSMTSNPIYMGKIYLSNG
jgi:hypothetical protein